MFNMFRKKENLPALPERPGFFSTDFETGMTREQKRARATVLLAAAFSNAINKPLKFYGMDGQEISGQAMDNNIQEVKWLNSNSFGIEPPIPQLDWYAAQTFIGWQTCAIISQQWLVNKALMMPAEDANRNGYELTVNDGTDIDPKIFDRIRELDEACELEQHLIDYLYFGRLFGVRIAMYDVRSPDADYYVKPFNPDGITPGSYRGIIQIDPYWVAPELDSQSAANPASHHFYEPTWWLINGKRIHRTHLCIMRNGGKLPDILKPTYMYGGLPVPQQIAERIYAAERIANEAPMLAVSKRMTIYKADLSEAAVNQDALIQKIRQWSELMNNYGIKMIGGDEEVNQFDLSLADLDAVIMTQYQIVAACAHVPATELLGTSPKGFNSTGEYEAKSYTKFLKSQQTRHLTPLLKGHYIRLMRSEISPEFSMEPLHIVPVWNSTDSPTAKEAAEVNLSKAQTDAQLVQVGAIDGFDVRQRLTTDKESGYNGIPDVVPQGPGDREHEQEQEQLAMQAKLNPPTDASDASENAWAAGVRYMASDGSILLMKRAGDKAMGGMWAFPAGHMEGLETSEQCARREFFEETTRNLDGELTVLSTNAGFILYAALGPLFAPALNDEHTEFMWMKPGEKVPSPLHPGVKAFLLEG